MTPADVSLPKDDLTQESLASQPSITPRRARLRAALQAVKYLASRALMIALIIFLGVFVTIIIMNRPINLGWYINPPQLDVAIQQAVKTTVDVHRQGLSTREREEFDSDAMTQELLEESGFNLPYLPRHLKWTLNSLQFDWGRLRASRVNYYAIWRTSSTFNLNDILVEYMPNTMLLATSAYLIVFMLGIPLALFLARHYGKWYDRVVAFLAPISSIPSWVIGILLIAIFAIQFNWLPYGRMVGNIPPETKLGYVPIVLKHMILPVSAIVLSIFFHLVYSWRSFFITFGQEDYVELGKAVGLSARKLQRNYILKPTLPYVITSFAIMFASFWQMTIALEVIFNWPGLGFLFINYGLPNLWGDSMYPGELLIALSVIVMFAYLLGAAVFLLDIIYVLIDPRIRLTQGDAALHLKSNRRWRWKDLKSELQLLQQRVKKLIQRKTAHQKQQKARIDFSLHRAERRQRFRQAVREIMRYPSAIIGLIIISLLVIGSLYAVIALPYEKIGEEWERNQLTGKPMAPQQAKPVYMNWFRQKKLLSTLILNSEEGDAERFEGTVSEDIDQIVLTFTFDYDYAEFPTEMIIYFSSTFTEKRTFTALSWRTPDGREIPLKDVAVGSYEKYDMNDKINFRRLMRDYESLSSWFQVDGGSPTPHHYLLFADPYADEARVLPGEYQLVIDALTFEPGNDIQAELILLGQVYGLAGTDYYRRDLLVPLVWGMPFALIVGLGGAVSTTILSMLVAATGVWFGGWVDNLVQRITDMNLVMPVLAIAVLAYAYLGLSLWVILIVFVFLNVFGTPTKNFRAAFLQVKSSPYIEAAKAYGSGNWRIISRYMVPRLISVLVPQLVVLIPSFVFLEATLGLFNINTGFPTWGTVIFLALSRGAMFSSRYWVLQPIALLLLTGLGFSMFGFALERILNPKLLEK
jgi:peptide/nickel transport system permease protein